MPQVVVQPFLRFTTGIQDAFNNASIPSAHGLPTHRRTIMTLTVQNKLPVDINVLSLLESPLLSSGLVVQHLTACRWQSIHITRSPSMSRKMGGHCVGLADLVHAYFIEGVDVNMLHSCRSHGGTSLLTKTIACAAPMEPDDPGTALQQLRDILQCPLLGL